MKHSILNRFTGELLTTAEIECKEGAPTSIKVGLSAKEALKNGVDLGYANLSYADLSDAYLSHADLRGANLSHADLSDADLRSADLRNTDLRGANLRGTYLSDANLRGADLRSADLRSADLSDANLRGTYLSDANLRDVRGSMDHVKSIQVESYSITYTSDILQIGCQRHTLQEWKAFDDERIFHMDGKSALRFWHKWKDWIFKTIEMSPAEPTRSEEK